VRLRQSDKGTKLVAKHLVSPVLTVLAQVQISPSLDKLGKMAEGFGGITFRVLLIKSVSTLIQQDAGTAAMF